MLERLKVVVVGCGQIADGHITEIRKFEKADVVAVCDIERLMAEQLAIRYCVPRFYDNLDEMLAEEKPHVVHITTPPQSHFSLAVKAIDAGCHVYVEKPLTLNYADSVKLVEYAQKNQKKLTIGWNSYFDPPAIELRTMVKDGVVGNPVHMESFFGYSLGGSFGKAILGSSKHWVHRLPGKLFQNNIDHMLNKVVEYLDVDEPVINVSGGVYREGRFGDVRDEMGDELRVQIQGKQTSAYCTFSSSIKPTGQFLRLYGTKRCATADFISRSVIFDDEVGLPSSLGRALAPFGMAKKYRKEALKNIKLFLHSEYHYFAGLNTLISNYYDSILNDEDPPISYDHILRVSWMMEEIFRQYDRNVGST
jgi:predicted dehydrogenase